MDGEKIYKKLEQIEDKLDNLQEWRAALDQRCLHHQSATNEARRTIYGNPGRADGMQFKVERLWNHKKSISKFQDFWIFVLKMLLAAAIIGIVVWLLSIYQKG